MGSNTRAGLWRTDDVRSLADKVVDDPLVVAAATLVIEHASANAVETLRAAGIRSILIKGPLLQMWLASAGAPRASTDVDLFVYPGDAGAAGRAFSALGYDVVQEVTPGVGQHATLWSAPGHVPVEIHETLWGAAGDAWTILAAETESSSLSGVSVEVPNEAARCLLVALHAARHGIGQDATLYDLERAVAVASRQSWEHAVDLARAVDAGSSFAAGLDLVPSGEQLRRELGLPTPSVSSALALDLATPKAGAPGYYWFAQQHGTIARIHFVVRKLVPPADFMRFKHAYARRGTVPLLITYLYRPLWLARWAIPGLLEWRRIRRGATALEQDRDGTQ